MDEDTLSDIADRVCNTIAEALSVLGTDIQGAADNPDERAWVAFACAGLIEERLPSHAALAADAMLVELRERRKKWTAAIQNEAGFR